MSVTAARAARLQIDPAEEGIQSLKRPCPEARQAENMEDYLRFLALKVGACDFHAALLSPPLVVDTIWHAHLLDTLHYEELCSTIGVPASVRVLHHNPEGGLDATARDKRLERAKQLYTQAFGPPPGGNWGRGAQKRGGVLAASQPPTTEQKTNASPAVDTINLKIATPDGNEVFYQCKTTTPLAQLMNAYCARACVAPATLRFIWSHGRVAAHDTPEAVSGRPPSASPHSRPRPAAGVSPMPCFAVCAVGHERRRRH